MGSLSMTASDLHTKYHRPPDRSSEYKGVPLRRGSASSAKIELCGFNLVERRGTHERDYYRRRGPGKGSDCGVRGSEAAQRIQKMSGVGVITASALVATIASPTDFRNGRQMAAWAGLVPRQHSSGGKSRLGRITRRGDSYLRGLLTQGARATLQAALRREPLKRSRLEQWILALRGRVGYHKTVVAIANKHLRIIWAILAKGEAYDPNAWRKYQHRAAAVSG